MWNDVLQAHQRKNVRKMPRTIPCPKCCGTGRIDAAEDRTGGRYAEARKLRKQGLTVREIAKRLGYKSTCSVAAALKQGN
jgi:AraC-like DNA-binding protein